MNCASKENSSNRTIHLILNVVSISRRNKAEDKLNSFTCRKFVLTLAIIIIGIQTHYLLHTIIIGKVYILAMLNSYLILSVVSVITNCHESTHESQIHSHSCSSLTS